MWGQGGQPLPPHLKHWIIPTRVGTRRCDRLLQCLCRDHPHACGDKAMQARKLLRLPGSSPRVWGQVQKLPYPNNFLGIIPTRVGTRLNSAWNKIFEEDHPHACGDKFEPLPQPQQAKGSSPRVWGQVRLSVASPFSERIIPTRVGTSDFCVSENICD